MAASGRSSDTARAWAPPEGWEVVIGCEVHSQLLTKAKLFSSAPNSFGAAPNTQTTEVDLGLPGVLPVANRHAVELAVRAGVALGCEIQLFSLFARKHYFYPDLPKGYQISQYEQPFSSGGSVPIRLGDTEREIPLTRIHMEEDAGKLVHDDALTRGASHVDLNRAGVPLIEIVSEPAISSPAEAAAYLRSLRAALRYLGVSECDMEKGNFRCDANVSVRPVGASELGTRVELKNINSFRFVERAIEGEVERQVELIEDGGEVVQETRHWDEHTGTTKPGRLKEDEDDYRYFPDPDLVPLRIEADWVEEIRRNLPELPHARQLRFERELGLSSPDAGQICEDRELADFFERSAELHGNAKKVANWTIRSLLPALGELGKPLSELALSPEHFSELIGLVDAGKVTAANAREVFGELAESGRAPAELLREKGLEAVSDEGELEGIAREVLDASPENVEQYRAGEAKVLNFFIGQIMKRTRGKANPAAVRAVLERLLA